MRDIPDLDLKADKLKFDLLFSYLLLSSLGTALLLVGLFATIGLRDYALALIEQSTPRVAAAENLQKSLIVSIANLRGWMASADDNYRIQRQFSWDNAIYPALKTMQALEQSDSRRSSQLKKVDAQLKSLESWQWHIEDVVHTPGNFAGQWVYDSKVALIIPTILSSSQALISLEMDYERTIVEGSGVQPMIRLRAGIFMVDTHLKAFLNSGLSFHREEYDKAMDKVEKAYQGVQKQMLLVSNDQLDQEERLTESLEALKYFAVKAINTRDSQTQNIAKTWMNTICLPMVSKLNRIINEYTAQERTQMQADADNIKWIAQLVPWLMLSLLIVMIGASIYLATSKTRQFILPVIQLKNQNKIKGELVELNTQSQGVLEPRILCERVLSYIAEHVNACAGTLFVVTDNRLKLAAGYAVPKSFMDKSMIIEPGEGLVGQVYSSKKQMLLTQPQSGMLAINTSLLEARPGAILVSPVMIEDRVVAVLELASLNVFNYYQQEFIERGLEQFAINLNDVSQKQLIEEALVVSQTQAHKLKAVNERLNLQREALEEQKRAVVDKVIALEASERTVKTRTSELVQAEKMASLGTLTAGVAHEINNPTNFVHVSVQNLEVDLSNFQQFIFTMAGDDADQEVLDSFTEKFKPLYAHINTIKNGTDRITAIVQDLRTFTHADAAQKQTVDINEVIQSTVNLVKTKYIELADIITQFDQIPPLPCYPAELNQVFMNLIINACDAIKDKQGIDNNKGLGQIIIASSFADDSKERAIVVTIKDNGCGMTERTKNKLFEPFYTTKEVGKGTGLGLSISYGIVQKHQGKLLVDSHLDIGTEFKVILPLD
jgi:signal transduction histidine kinase